MKKKIPWELNGKKKDEKNYQLKYLLSSKRSE